jgi:hypothetical protein
MSFPSSLRRGCAPVSEPQIRLSRQHPRGYKLTNANDCKTLMDEHSALTDVTSGPVGPAVALSLGESNKSGPVSSGVWEVMDGKYATHFCLWASLVTGSNLSHHQSSQNFCGVTRLLEIR